MAGAAYRTSLRAISPCLCLAYTGPLVCYSKSYD
jgi:hypothetical protein